MLLFFLVLFGFFLLCAFIYPPKKDREPLKGRSYSGDRKDLQAIARNLNTFVPKSEQWFRKLIRKEKLGIRWKYNYVIEPYIADAYCKELALIVEVDGSVHDNRDQRFKDNCKDEFLSSRGFKVLRVKAYSMESYDLALQEIKRAIQKIR